MLRKKGSRGRAMKVVLLIGIAILAVPQLALAVISFHQLDDDLFVISHRVKVKFWTSRGQAVRMVYEKAASLCVAAGYRHLEILHQESDAEQWVDDANASLQIRFFLEADEERLDCRRNASDRYIQQAAVKLAKRGYRPPPPAAGSSAEVQTDSGSARSD